MVKDDWYSEKWIPPEPVPLKINSWNDLAFTRFVPLWDGHVLLELYLYLKLRVKANFPHGYVQTQVMREGTVPPDPALPNNLTVGRRNQTLTQMTTASPEFGWPLGTFWAGACDPEVPLTWQIFIGPEFLTAGQSTLYAKAYRQIRPWQLS